MKLAQNGAGKGHHGVAKAGIDEDEGKKDACDKHESVLTAGHLMSPL